MTSTFRRPEDFPTLDLAAKELLRGSSGWMSCGAVLGLCAGFSAPVAGSILTLISWIRDPAWHGFALHHAATTLFVLTIPLLILGAHCLDLLDREKRRMKNVEGN